MLNESISVYLFGDSITFGQLVSPHKTWAVQLSKHLSERLHPNDVLLCNASINGNTTRQGLERMPYDIQGHRPDYIVTQFGMNDCNYWKTDEGLPRVSEEAFVANMREIVNRGLRFGARKVVMLTTHPTTRTKKFEWARVSYQESNHAYCELIRNAVKFFNGDPRVQLIDVEKIINSRVESGEFCVADLLLEDNLHLSERGNEVYFEIISPILEDLISNDFKK